MGGVVRVKRAKYMVTEDDLTWGMGTQCNILIVYHRNVHLKPI